MCKYPFRTLRRTLCASIRKINQLMLCTDIIAYCCKNNAEHMCTLCGQNALFLLLKVEGKILTTRLWKINQAKYKTWYIKTGGMSRCFCYLVNCSTSFPQAHFKS